MFHVEAAALEQIFQAFNRVLVAVFRMNTLTLIKAQCRIQRIDSDRLATGAFKVQFHPRLCFVPERYMGKSIRFEVTAELAVDTDEKIFVERSGDAGTVVIGCVQDIAILHQIYPKQ